MLALTSASQLINNISKEIVGKWVLKKQDLIIDNKKEPLPIEDTSFYTFSANNTYTLICNDFWEKGKAQIIGKWKSEGEKIKLYDIAHVSPAKGALSTNGQWYYIEVKNIDTQQYLLVSKNDKELKKRDASNCQF